MKRFTFLLAFLFLLVLPIWAQDTAKPAMERNAMIIGWDGADRNHIKALLKEGRLPNLQKLVSEGAFVDIDVTSGATDTKAGWTQILTGYKPEITGVYSNARFRDVPEGYSIFERLKMQYGKDNIAAVSVIAKKAHCGEIDPPFKKPLDQVEDRGREDQKRRKKPTRPRATEKYYQTVEEKGVKYVVFNGSPYYTMHKSCDEWHFGLMKDTAVGDRTLMMLDKYSKKPFFFFVHFAEVDHSGHQHGEKSKEYDDAIISNDAQLGRLVAKLKELGVYGNTWIYVTADHGFDIGERSHKRAPYVFLGTNDKQITRKGSRTDLAPTVLDRLGIDLGKISPSLDGGSLAQQATKATVLSGAVSSGDASSLAKHFAGQFRFGFGGTNYRGIRTVLGNNNAIVTKIIIQHSNIISLNGFYPNVIRPKSGVWNWSSPDQLLTFADQHPDWSRRAHVPFWPFNDRNHMEWLLKDEQGKTVDRQTAIARLREHYLTVMGRYKGRFQYWDVINEVVNPSQSDGIHKGLWKDVIGPELVELAFRFAREADPEAKLFYNDFHEWLPAKRAAIIKLVTDLKAKGLIDGIGLQQHVSLTAPSIKELDESLALYSGIGLEIHITELDIDMNPTGQVNEFITDMAVKQAERYRELFSLYKKYAGKITAVMTWNITDADTWLARRPNRPKAPNWPLLFDKEGKPKPAFYSILAK